MRSWCFCLNLSPRKFEKGRSLLQGMPSGRRRGLQCPAGGGFLWAAVGAPSGNVLLSPFDLPGIAVRQMTSRNPRSQAPPSSFDRDDRQTYRKRDSRYACNRAAPME